MKFSNHIANRFLTDDTLAYEVIETTLGGDPNNMFTTREKIEAAGKEKIRSLWRLVNKDNQKAYLVTNTVHDKLDLLKVKKDSKGEFNWTVFNNIPHCKKTFILTPIKDWGGGGCLRILVEGNVIEFCHVCFRFNEGEKVKGKAFWTLFYIDRVNNFHAEHCKHSNVQDIYEFVYKLLCFVFLSENEYEIIAAGSSNKATKKNGKIKNDLPIPITIINSKWNVTTIRAEGFLVSGHFALRRCGTGRCETRMVYIEPYQKTGYIRHAKNNI